MLVQISIFAENNRGAMQRITGILAKEGINILGSVTNDSAEYGIVRMVVSDPERAKEKFQEAGYICRTTDVLAVEISDQPGSLDYLLRALSDSNVSINYLYLSFARERSTPIMILQTDDILEVEECLKGKGFAVL